VVYVDDLEGLFGGIIDVGDTVTGSYVYTTDFTSGYGEPEYQVFRFGDPFEFSVRVGEFEFRSDPEDTSFRIAIGNDHFSRDSYSIRSGNNILVGSDVVVTDLCWLLADYTLSALSSSALPSAAPNIEDFETNTLYVMYGDEGWSFLGAEVTSATTTVIPEPCTFVLIGAGIVLLGKRRKA